jgi:hypothetical protein
MQICRQPALQTSNFAEMQTEDARQIARQTVSLSDRQSGRHIPRQAASQTGEQAASQIYSHGKRQTSSRQTDIQWCDSATVISTYVNDLIRTFLQFGHYLACPY